jgi:hypothetical protein
MRCSISHAKNAADAGITNVEFVKGYLEELPLADAGRATTVTHSSTTDLASLCRCSHTRHP